LLILPLCRLAAVGALVAALGVAGCGRKGGLDPPPGAAVYDPTLDAGAAAGPGRAADGQASVPAPPPPRARTPVDWLID
jgi:predicted small lipoprotein YifL